MSNPSKRTVVAVWSVLGLTVLVIAVAFVRERARAARAANIPVLFPIQPFTLTNQSGNLFSSTQLQGQVWVADIIFTACGGPCPRMTAAMADLQRSVDASLPVHFVTLTTDPVNDTPAVLARYGQRYDADPARWHFLTGSKAQIKAAAVDALKFTALEKDPAKRESPDDLFIHSTIFVVIDKAGNARAVFEMDEAGAREQLLDVVRALARDG